MDYTFERRSAARRKGLAKMGPERLREVAAKTWAKRRANGTDRPPPEKRAEIRAKHLETLRRNRAARAMAMTPEERMAEVVRRHERYAAGARRGWRTRRRNAGLDPARPAEAATVARLYVADVEALRSYFGPDVKRSVRAALEGMALAVEVGAIRWTGDGWALGAGRPVEAQREPPPASAYPEA